MARSNTHYYNLCTHWGPISEDGFCDFHRSHFIFSQRNRCTPPGEYITRRGIVKRQPRFPLGIKTWHSPPPLCVKKLWRRQARAKQKQQFLKNPDDPVITPMKRLINLWNWY